MRLPSKLTAALAAGAFALVGLPAAAQAAPAPAPATVHDDGTVTVRIIAINDIHGRIGAMTVPWAGTIEQARAENPDSLLISSGDNQGASLFASAIADDVPIMDVLGAMDLDATAVGNHEFDKGQDDLVRIGEHLGLPELGANVYDETGAPFLPEYSVLEIAGLKVGVIGTAPNDLATLVSASAVEGLTIGDEIEATNRVAAQIADEVDLVVAAMHMGGPLGEPEGATWESETAKPGSFLQRVDTELSAEVDVVLNAHTHRVYNWVDTVEETGTTRPVVQTGEYMNNIGVIEVTYDPAAGEVVGFTSEIRPRTDAPADELIAAYPRVAEVDRIVQDALAEAAVLGEVQVGTIGADITREGVAADDTAFPGESALGNLITDMFLAEGAQYGADIAMGNAGGVRADLLVGDDGVVTYSELQAVMPFVNNQMVVELTGAQIVELIGQQFRADGSYNHISFSSNLTYTYDPATATVLDVYLGGAPIDLEASYGLITYAFLATGTTGFPVFLDAASVTDTGRIDLDMFRDAFAPSIDGEPVMPDFARRSVQLIGAPDAAVAPGATVEFELGDLDLTSAGAPLAQTVRAALVSADGERVDLGEFAAADGAAAISFAVPQVAGGAWTVELTVVEAGTVVRVPLEIVAAAPADPDASGTEAPAGERPDAGTSADRTPTAPAADSLASTGAADLGGIAALAGALVVGGAVLARRRSAV